MKNLLKLAVLAGAVTSAIGFAAGPAAAAPVPDGPDKNVTNVRHTSHDTNRNTTNNRNRSHDTNRNVTYDQHTSHDTNRSVRNDLGPSQTITYDRHTSHDTHFTTNYNTTNDYGTHVLPDINLGNLPVVGSLLN